MLHATPKPVAADSLCGFARDHEFGHAGRMLVLAGLVALCLVPRAIMAWKLTAICPDAVHYIQAAAALEDGRFVEAFRKVQFNVLPVVLMLLHRAGLPWETAGTWWSVVISSCTVLPLYGLVRRQFDDRVAVAAGFLYAVHWDLIRWSPEILRDPTFWFLLALSLYIEWRAVTELRWPLFLAAGFAVALAVMTRIEGLLLLAPLVLWSVWRAVSRGEQTSPDTSVTGSRLRWKLIVGIATCVSVWPLLITLVSTFWIRTHTPLQLVRTDPARLASQWFKEGWKSPTVCNSSALPPSKIVFEPTTTPPAIAEEVASVARASQSLTPFPRNGELPTLSLVGMLGLFGSTMVKGLTPVFLLLLLAGVWTRRHAWKRPEHQVLFCTSMLFGLAAWIHLWSAHTTCSRYFFPIAIMAAPFAGLGLLWAQQWAAKAAVAMYSKRPKTRTVLAWSLNPAIAIALLTVVQLSARDCGARAASIDLGRWIGQQYGPAPSVFGPDGFTQVVSYYARAQCQSFSAVDADAEIAAYVGRTWPDVVLLPAEGHRPAQGVELVRQIEGLGFVQADCSQIASRCRKVLVLTRS